MNSTTVSLQEKKSVLEVVQEELKSWLQYLQEELHGMEDVVKTMFI